MHRLLHVEGAPIVVRAWEQPSGEITFRAGHVGEGGLPEQLEVAVERQRFALGVDDDLSEFYERFKRDKVLGPVIHRKPWMRSRRTVWPWQALLRAITKQLIESSRAAAIERRIVRRWGIGAAGLLDVPGPEVVREIAPAELVACDLTEARSLAMLRCAREVASGRADLFDPASDRRLRAIREIGPWTVKCVGLDGRGDPDSLPAGDLSFIKLVGVLAGLGRRATVEEVEEYYAPYEPYRGLAGIFMLHGLHKAVSAAPPVTFAA